MKQKLFTFFLALVASVSAIYAQSGTCGDNLTWTLSNGTLTISGTGAMEDYYSYSYTPWYDYHSSIRSVIINDGVTSIGKYAFCFCSKLTSVTIPESVTSIGESAFYNCSSLTSITIGNSVTSIGSSAFSGCSSLTSVTIPESVTSIGDGAFDGCSSIASPVYNAHCFAYMPTSYSGAYTIPEGIKQIAGGAFEGCSSLTSITIPNSVTSIGDYAFYGCSSLTSINVDANNANYCSIDGVLFSKDKTTLIQYPIGNTRSEYIIPNSVTSIGNQAFYGCSSLTSITIGNSVTSIGSSAFSGCSSLTSVTIPESVTSIGGSAFWGCSSLTSVTIPNSVTSIGGGAFQGCSSLTSVTIPESVTSIGAWAFRDCTSLTSVTIGDGVTSIGNYAFDGCSSLTSVTIPNSVTSIENRAFEDCSSLTSITCEAATPPTIGGTYTFYGVSKSIPVYVPCECVEAYKAANGWEDFTNIQELLAEYSIEVYVNDTIMGTAKVNYNTFCEGAQISASPNIGYHFVQWSDRNTDNPRTLELMQDISLTAEFAQSFSGQCGDSLYWELVDTTLHITGKGEMYDYKSDSVPWKLLVSSIKVLTIAEDVTKLNQSFTGCSVLESIVWNAKHAADAYSDGQYVYPIFYGIRSQIKSFTLGENVEYIPTYLCTGMDKLISVTIPNSVTSIGTCAFRDCSSLTSVHITDLAAWCNIDFVDFRANPLYIAHNLYLNGELVKDLVIPNGVTSIGNYAFDGCSSLTSVTIPNSVTSIGNSAFDGRTSLTSITCEAENPPTVGSDAFYNVSKSIPVYVPCGCVGAYKAKRGWADFTNIQVPLAEYSIEVYVNDTIMGTAKVNYNTFCEGAQISASPNIGYHFVQWNDGNTDNPRTLELTQNTTLTAEFALNQYTVTTLASHNERGTTQGDTTVNYLDSVTITANSNYGYHFVQWNDGNSDNPRQVQVTVDTTYTATFDKNTYAISLSCNEEQGSVEGVTSAEYLDTVTISATPNIGYHFVQWIDGNTDTIRTLVLTQDTTLTAEFAQSFSGQCGDNLYWELVDTTLHITGKGEMYDYKSDSAPWKLLVSSIKVLTIAEDVTKLNQSFTGCSVLESIVWNAKHAADAYSDGQYAYPIFYGIRSQIKSFTLGENVEYIPTYLCTGMDKLTSMTIPNSVTSIGNAAFRDCSSLTSVTIGNGVTSIGKSAFEGCSSLTSVTTPNSLNTIGISAFEGCARLGKISLGTGLEEIAANAFAGCTRLYDIYVYATYPPFAEESSFANYNVYVYVPCEYQRDYTLDIVWGKFKFIECIESEDATTDGDVTVVPGYNDVTITWPTAENADSYSLVINKDNQPFCTLTFNQEGQLLNIAFAPSRDGNNHPAQYAAQTVSGYRFTVTGLTEATQYAYNITTKDADNNTIATYSGEFTTMGGTTTAVEDILQNTTNVQKLLRNGQLIIVRDGVEYNAMGQEL